MFDKSYISSIIQQINDGSRKFKDLSVFEQITDEIARAGLIKDGLNLKYLTQKQQNDKSLVKLAVQSNPDAYDYVSILLQRDAEIAWLTLNQNCSDELLKDICYKFYTRDKDIAKYIISKSAYVYSQVKNFQSPTVQEILQ